MCETVWWYDINEVLDKYVDKMVTGTDWCYSVESKNRGNTNTIVLFYCT